MPGGRPNLQVMQLLVTQNRLQQMQLLQQVQQEIQQKKVLDELTRELDGKGPEELKTALRDQRPEMRWLAARVVGEKMLPLHRELIELLTDDNRYVRQSARQSLVGLSKAPHKAAVELKSTSRVSRGVDFGPHPEANRVAQKIAARKWGEWLDRQETKATSSR